MTKIRTGLTINFIYKGEKLIENIYGDMNDVWFNFKCLYPGAEAIDYETIYREI